MVNTNKLKGKMTEYGLGVEAVAKKLHMSNSAFYRKLQGKCKGFSVQDASELAKILHLTADEIQAIFFAEDVA